MTCREVSEFLLEFVAGELPPPLVAEFESHLFACANCQEFLNQYRETIALGRAASAPDDVTDPPTELVDAILQTLARIR